jgi:aryl-alcohol dehydrogenase-like predicted oxidoreductase
VNAPIIGATKVEHIDEAVGSVDIPLSDDDIAKLEEPYKVHRILGHS